MASDVTIGRIKSLELTKKTYLSNHYSWSIIPLVILKLHRKWCCLHFYLYLLRRKNIALSLVFCQKEDSLESYLHHTEKKIHRQLQELGLKTWRNKKKDYFKDTPWSSMIDRRRANLKIFLDAGEDQDKGMKIKKKDGKHETSSFCW